VKAVLLAAGRGERLWPITQTVPKPMIRVAGKPILEYGVELLRDHQFSELFINLHHLPETICQYFGDGSACGVSIHYVWEETVRGTAGAVKAIAADFAEPFLVFYGDQISTCDLTRLWAFHREHLGVATLVVHERSDVRQSGVVRLRPDLRIVEFVEKPQAWPAGRHYVNAGMYVLEPVVVEQIPSAPICDFGRDVFPALLQSGCLVYGCPTQEPLFWFDTHEDLERGSALFSKADARLPR